MTCSPALGPILSLLTGAAGAAAGPPDLLLSDGRHLARVRDEAGRDPAIRDARDRLREEADALLAEGPWSVVHKTRLPAGADPHDYRSLGPYWWPDPQRPGGLPWVRRDGERNPEAATGAWDADRHRRMRGAVSTLALAWFLTGHEPYAERAARVLRAWYLDPATRMNPHLRYGQAIPGITEGRGIGIIETARLPELLDRAALLEGSPAWREEDRRGLRGWMAAYLDWLLASPEGRDEDRTTNNHGTWYDVQVAALALRAGRPEVARERLDATTRRRIAAQVEPDGRQPRELGRTRSLSYSLMNLEGFLQAAALGDRAGVDLWRYETADGRSLLRALDFLLPYADPAARWPHPQITPVPWSTFDAVLRIAARRYPDPRFASALARLPPEARADPRWLLHPGPSPPVASR